TLGVMQTFRGHYEDAEPVSEQALALAEALGGRRYQALLLCLIAEARFQRGDVVGARERNRRALALARDTGMRFCGPLILGLDAKMQESGPERDRLRDEAEALITVGGVGHSPIGYH